MRLPILCAMILAAGCAAPDPHTGHGAERWTFTQRTTAEDVSDIGSGEGFSLSIVLDAASNMRQIGGQWHASLAQNETVTLRFNASADMTVEWRVKSGTAGASGRCDWGPEGHEKDVGVGHARMSNTTRTCEIEITPAIELADPNEPTLRWEARSREPQPTGWNLTFEAART